ncbi:p53-induced death domain-containing protein 1-like isoform X2 [Ptychodera flava]|uniref:p53-induced death domain-containing protein 1-like isoform X2 n=1 Tax=Ptychodera flava TaxID=63121 RepID=UPI003969D1BE
MMATGNGSEVDLSRRNLYTFPTYLTKGSGILRLKLQINMLKSLPPEMANMRELEEIFCSNNQFEEFPEVLCRLDNLASLDMAGNKLKNLPAEVANLKNLKKLWLGWNVFHEFPLKSCASELTALKELHLCNNSIVDVPENIFGLENLEIFDLSHNKVQELPEAIGDLINLKTLDISYNIIEALPYTVCDLVHLKTLKASSNQITRLPSEFGESLHQVKVLNLAGNPLANPPIDVCNKGIDAIRKYQEQRRESTENNRKNDLADCVETDFGGDDRRTDRIQNPKTRPRKSSQEEQKTRHHSVDGNGKVSARIDPNNYENHIIHVSSDIELKVSSDAVKEEVNVTAEFVENPAFPLLLGDHEFIVTDFLDLGPDGLTFKEPMLFNLKCHDDLDDKMREIVVRTTNDDGSWSDVKTWKEGCTIKAEVEHFSGLVAVSKPKQHSVILTDVNTLSVSCVKDDIAVDVQTPKENKNVIRMVMELQNVERDTLLRACELVGEYDDDFVAMGTILKIQQDAEKFGKPISLTLPLPELSEVNHVAVDQLRKRGILKVLRDHNDDNWNDVTDDVIHHMTPERCMSFTESNLPWPCCRYVTVFAERGVNIESIAQMATRMARKGWKIVNLVLLQNIKNPKSLYVDCVVKEKLNDLLARLLDTGYEARGTLPYTRDIDLPEGEKVVLEVGGENIQSMESKKTNLTFYSRRDNHVILHVSLGNEVCTEIVNAGDDYTGFVDFMKFKPNTVHAPSENSNDNDMAYDRLWFGIPKPEIQAPNSPKSDIASQDLNESQKFTYDITTEGVEIAIDILSSRLLQRDWRRLARKLGLSDVDIDSLEHNYQGDLREQIHQMFRQWRQKEGDHAAVKTLISALDELQIRNLCHAIKRCWDSLKKILVQLKYRH